MISLRKNLFRAATATVCAATVGGGLHASEPAKKPLNIMLITADDLHRDSLGCYGGKPEGMTPNIDKFATESLRFERAHVNCAICAPSRAILGTGLYGHNSGAMGFQYARPDVPTVIGLLQKNGYMTGILGKVDHSTPNKSAQWDFSKNQKSLGDGRDPEKYYEYCKEFFANAKAENQPFYFMVNSHDPHRPFHYAGKTKKGSKEPSKTYTAKEAVVPGFLADLSGVKKEVAAYQNSVRRFDDTFGKVMQALEESGQKDNTLVVFISDNGIAMPFAKANAYLASSLTPWIVRWPGRVKENSINRDDFISGIDFLPTVLEVTGIKKPRKLDGVSFLPLLDGETQAGRERVFTQIDAKISGPPVPMRCIQDKKYGYIFNAWSDGELYYSNNNQGRSWGAMKNSKEKAIQENYFLSICYLE